MVRLTDYNSLTFKIIRVDLKTTFCLVKVKGHWTSKKTKKVKTATSFFKMILWGSKKYFSCNFIGLLTRRMIPIIIPSWDWQSVCICRYYRLPMVIVNVISTTFIFSLQLGVKLEIEICVVFCLKVRQIESLKSYSSYLTFTFIVCTRHLNGRRLKGLTFNW